MKPAAGRSIECSQLPILSSRTQGWESILVEQFQYGAGEGNTYYSQEHAICLSLAPRPVGMLQIQGEQTYRGTYAQGDFCLTPAQMPFFARWDGDDRFLQIRIPALFLQTIAAETGQDNADRLELLPCLKRRDPQIEAIALLLRAELQQESAANLLYIDSLANVLAVYLLRHHTTTQPQIPVYEGGLPQRQLMHVLDYINDHLEQPIKLVDLAKLLAMSQFHFSHLFKQSLGVSPYRYLLQQRVERAKQLLHQSDRSIVEIALLCGFNSHSHLSQQFRQLTGLTPKAYRTQIRG